MPTSHYELIFPEPNAVPVDLSYEVGPDDVAEVDVAFHADVEGRTYYEGRFFFRPWSFGSLISPSPTPAGVVRHDWITAGDTLWGQTVDVGDEQSFAPMDEQVFRTYAAGEQLEVSWVEGPIHARIPAGYGERFGDLIGVSPLPWSDQDDHLGYPAFTFEGGSYDHFLMQLRDADGDVIGETTEPFAEFPVPPERAAYELQLDASRDTSWWTHATSTSTTWRFWSERPPGEDFVSLGVLEVSYDLALALDNTTDSPSRIGFDVHAVDEVIAPITAFDAAWSVDDGDTWTDLDVADLGGGAYEGTVTVPISCDPCDVSLRVAAEDETGRAIDQEIIRAYTASYTEPTETPTTSPPTETPTATTTTTLPGTGGGDVGWLAGLSLVGLLAGGVLVGVARRRLSSGAGVT